jgi:hypothetical protein
MKNFFQWMEAGKKGETGKNERKGGSRNTRLTYQKWVQTAAVEASASFHMLLLFISLEIGT